MRARQSGSTSPSRRSRRIVCRLPAGIEAIPKRSSAIDIADRNNVSTTWASSQAISASSGAGSHGSYITLMSSEIIRKSLVQLATLLQSFNVSIGTLCFTADFREKRTELHSLRRMNRGFENITDLGFRATAMVSRSHPQSAMCFIGKVSNGEADGGRQTDSRPFAVRQACLRSVCRA